jgi:signal transduction histidine kinase
VFFRALLPRTLWGRMVLVVLGGLLLAHATSMSFLAIERGRAIERFEAAEIAARIAEMVRAGDGARRDTPTPGPAGTTGPAPSATERAPPRPRSRFAWRPVDRLDDPPPSADVPELLATELQRRLLDELGTDPVAWIASSPYVPLRPGGSLPPRGPFEPFAGEPRLLTVALKLAGGKFAMVEARTFKPSLHIPGDVWVSIAMLFAVTAAFSVWAARLALTPVRMLASAADRLSRNLEEPPLPEEGAQEIREAAHAFNRMQDRLRRHVRTRALAFAAMSHDMRTPLTRMRLRLESLSDEALLGKLSHDLDEIEALTKSALAVTRELSQDEAPAPVDLRALVDSVVGDFVALDHAIAVSGNARPMEARPRALKRALGNLLDNAVTYGREVSVAISDANGHAVVVVSDRGPGIPEAEIEKVFAPYYRIEGSRSRETGGTGLGLAIAKDIVEAHGGQLKLANRAGGGLEATVLLPRAPSLS